MTTATNASVGGVASSSGAYRSMQPGFDGQGQYQDMDEVIRNAVRSWMQANPQLGAMSSQPQFRPQNTADDIARTVTGILPQLLPIIFSLLQTQPQLGAMSSQPQFRPQSTADDVLRTVTGILPHILPVIFSLLQTQPQLGAMSSQPQFRPQNTADDVARTVASILPHILPVILSLLQTQPQPFSAQPQYSPYAMRN